MRTEANLMPEERAEEAPENNSLTVEWVPCMRAKVVRGELTKRGITPHESAGKMFVMDREVKYLP